jgi:acetate kinase
MHILTINSGSSSLKAALYDLADAAAVLLDVDVGRIGLPGGNLRIRDAHGGVLLEDDRDLDDHESVLHALFEWLSQRREYGKLDAIGHRVVHGGFLYSQPTRIWPELIEELQALVPFAPNHMPAAISGIRAVSKLYPSLPQVACFDTAFHRHMPKIAQMYALPRALFDEGVLRYGFHGLSYEYITQELRELEDGATHRVIVAHLGNGASIAAIRDGVSLDTSMGFTPVSGLVMGTRCGDVDPGILLYLMQEKGMSAEAVSELIYKQSGLLGASGISADMKDLLDQTSNDARAAEAIDLFCYQVKKHIGAYAAALGGLDTLVFTAGIGENAAPVRARICDELEFLGIHIAAERNAAHAPVISREDSRVTVRVIKTNEDLVMARHTRRLCG